MSAPARGGGAPSRRTHDHIALALANPAVKGVKRNMTPYTACSRYIDVRGGNPLFAKTKVVGFSTKQLSLKQGLRYCNDFAIARV